jgi:hypothetical protein
MRTRSQSKRRVTFEEQIAEYNMIEPAYEVEIDFDRASKSWYMNKIALPNSTCKYICLGKTKTGNKCKRTPIIYTNYCTCHKKSNIILDNE